MMCTLKNVKINTYKWRLHIFIQFKKNRLNISETIPFINYVQLLHLIILKISS